VSHRETMQEVLKIQSSDIALSSTSQISEGLKERKEFFFLFSLNAVRDSAFQIKVGRSFHQHGTMNENVLESDFEALCDGTTSRHSLTDRRLLVGM